ncbi:MAG: methylmalonyl Co-A mutase-associated GTPase MeaB, partial [Janibacter sp.]|nr:methylmalonyl Co-A mutase-associated GTPase MeaB [Janibacter sp.]
RAEQQREWMWAMVDAELRDAVRRSPRVRGLLGGLTPGVRSGEVSAVDGAARILEAFSTDLAERSGD